MPRGIILAGGLGTRLMPLTKITNKHLLPVYDRPMVYFPIQMLVDVGIEDIMIVTGGNYAGDFFRLLENGEAFGLKQLHYTYQKGNRGIADALRLTEWFARREKIVVVLGDNFLEKGIADHVKQFETQPVGARVLLKPVHNPQEFGIATVRNAQIVDIQEKPRTPVSDRAIIGVYMYDSEVYDIIRELRPSARGELEISDVNRKYMERGLLKHGFVDGAWADCGESFDSYLLAQALAAKMVNRRK